ncbi:MAG: hypothetical protein CMJ78_26940 [Planctomycetaceae bacterium]|nr:hypothetical protein [Planctomycetaceae bacterium]
MTNILNDEVTSPSPFEQSAIDKATNSNSAEFEPSAPISLEHAGVSDQLVESLILKYLLTQIPAELWNRFRTSDQRTIATAVSCLDRSLAANEKRAIGCVSRFGILERLHP